MHNRANKAAVARPFDISQSLILSLFEGIFSQTALKKQKPCTQDNTLHTGLFSVKVRNIVRVSRLLQSTERAHTDQGMMNGKTTTQITKNIAIPLGYG